MKNRVIKFRAWDTKHKRFISEILPDEDLLDGEDWCCVDTNDIYFYLNIDLNTLFDKYSCNNRIIFQQFTGLLDKDKKEIYEGDITEITAEGGAINRFVVEYGIARRKINMSPYRTPYEIDIPSFYFNLIDGDFKAFPIVNNYKQMHDLDMMTIVGNVFENTDLLVKKGENFSQKIS